MPGKKKEEEGGGGAPEWMCTFSDMMSLLLCFFVLLFSLATIEKVKFYQAIGSIQGALGRIPNMFNTSYTKPLSIQPQKVKPVQRNRTIERAKEAIAKKARSKLVANERSKEIVVEGVREGIRFSVAGRLLFEPGVAIIKEDAKEILMNIAEILNDFPTLHVRVEGHTNDIPFNSPYMDNWRLAEARAFNTMLYLKNYGNVDKELEEGESRLSYMSCGPYRPRYPNDSVENRALNRRVEIVLLQGERSEVITGVLEGSEEQKEMVDENELVPDMQGSN